jgi:hypothetical protein
MPCHPKRLLPVFLLGRELPLYRNLAPRRVLALLEAPRLPVSTRMHERTLSRRSYELRNVTSLVHPIAAMSYEHERRDWNTYALVWWIPGQEEARFPDDILHPNEALLPKPAQGRLESSRGTPNPRS